MAWTVGNFFGTTFAAAPFRCTSQASGSGIAGDLSIEQYKQTLHDGARRILELVLEGYRVVKIKRAQNRLAQLDPASLHGFVILWLTKEKSEDCIYVRIDWGMDGLWKQEADDPEELMSYLEQQTHYMAGAAAATAVGGMGVVGVAGMTASAETAVAAGAATQAGATATTGAAAMSAYTLAAYATGAAVVLVGGCAITAEFGKWAEDYVPVRDPDSALPDLYKLISELEQEKPEYSLSEWNCNHFANFVMEKLAPPVETNWSDYLPDVSGASSMLPDLPNGESLSLASSYLPSLSWSQDVAETGPTEGAVQEAGATSMLSDLPIGEGLTYASSYLPSLSWSQDVGESRSTEGATQEASDSLL